MKYFNRALLVVQLAIMALWLTSRIGEPAAANAITWSGAWMAFAICAAFSVMGFCAGHEWASNRGNK